MSELMQTCNMDERTNEEKIKANMNDELIDKVVRMMKVNSEMSISRELTARCLIKLVEQTQWVKVSDRLPESIDGVLVYVDNDGFKFIDSAYISSSGQWSEYHNVTHWQPLPNAPEIDK